MLFVTAVYFWFWTLSVLTKADIIQNHLGIKTTYKYVSNVNNIPDNNLEGCAQKIWMLVRYGAINPNVTHIQKMRGYLGTLQDIIVEKNSDVHTSKLSQSDIELFENWRPKVNENDARKLTAAGAREMAKLAKRMQARFPDALPPIYSNTSYSFKFTRAQRTRRSAQSFALGLFHNLQVVKDIDFPEAITRDPILSFYKLCPKWEETVKNNYVTYEERRKFENSEVMKRAIEKINNKLNLNNILSLDDVYLMYTTCAFETTFSKRRKSPWCVPFDLDTIKVIEYAEDLKYYWKDGYGYEITYKQACKTFNDMLNFINDKKLEHKATLHFIHSEALLKMLAHLNLYKDGKPLTAVEYDKNHDRKWRVSKMDPFGSNLAFISNRCNATNKLLVLHNEIPVRLPSCPDSDLCDIEKVKQYYSSSVVDCSFDSICQNNEIST